MAYALRTHRAVLLLNSDAWLRDGAEAEFDAQVSTFLESGDCAWFASNKPFTESFNLGTILWRGGSKICDELLRALWHVNVKPRSWFYEQDAMLGLVQQNSSFVQQAGVRTIPEWDFMYEESKSRVMLAHVAHPSSEHRWPFMCSDAVRADMWNTVPLKPAEALPVRTPFQV